MVKQAKRIGQNFFCELYQNIRNIAKVNRLLNLKNAKRIIYYKILEEGSDEIFF